LTGGDARNDLALLCGVFDAAEREMGGRACSEMSVPEREASAARVESLSGELCNSGIISAWSAIGIVGPADKYRLMKEGAAQQGLPDWTCPAMERCYGSIQVPKCTPIGSPCRADDFCCFGSCDGGTCQCLPVGAICQQATDCCKNLYCNKRDSRSTEFKCRGERDTPCTSDDDCAQPAQCEGSTHRCH
jgi:hypothetical protein